MIQMMKRTHKIVAVYIVLRCCFMASEPWECWLHHARRSSDGKLLPTATRKSVRQLSRGRLFLSHNILEHWNSGHARLRSVVASLQPLLWCCWPAVGPLMVLDGLSAVTVGWRCGSLGEGGCLMHKEPRLSTLLVKWVSSPVGVGNQRMTVCHT